MLESVPWLLVIPWYTVAPPPSAMKPFRVREMGGDIPETVFRWRAEIADGTRTGPRILTSGPKVDGPQPIWPGSIAVSDPESARAAVRRLKSMAADFVKIYAVGFPPEVLAALVDEGNAQGLRVGGHLPFETTTVREAIDGGVKFLEHLFYSVLPGCSPDETIANSVTIDPTSGFARPSVRSIKRAMNSP